MNRRSFLSSLLGAAVASCVRWLPMPEKVSVVGLNRHLDHLILDDIESITDELFGGKANRQRTIEWLAAMGPLLEMDVTHDMVDWTAVAKHVIE